LKLKQLYEKLHLIDFFLRKVPMDDLQNKLSSFRLILITEKNQVRPHLADIKTELIDLLGNEKFESLYQEFVKVESDICVECGIDENDFAVVLCDYCNSGHHYYCLGLTDIPTDKNWYCPNCLTEKAHEIEMNRKQQEATEKKLKKEMELKQKREIELQQKKRK